MPVTLRLYDTMSRSLRAFEPVRTAEVSMYLCGATVQSPPHIGHIRSGLNFDIIRRWLTHRGYEVTFIRNVTDIDDKILARSAAAGVPWWAWAAINERAFTEAYDVLGCLRPTLEPRATGHVTEMITLMQELIDAGHAYTADGDVYFDVLSYPAYGRLSGQQPDQMQAAGDSVGDARKRDVRDFALWKSARPGEPSWPTPWGDGRPGWHLECSAMASTYLGREFDIHGGGLDLIFPHHENEIAQSVGAGQPFARYWMHNAWVTAAGEKMSKSLGNGLLVSEMVARVRPIELRYYLGTPHYRSTIEFSPDALAEAGAGYRRIENFVARAVELVPVEVDRGDPGPVGPSDEPAIPTGFATAMDDDFGVPAALGVLHETVRAGNAALAADDKAGVQAGLAQVLAMTDVLGLNPLRWRGGPVAPDLTRAVDALVRVVTGQRQNARDRRDFQTADRIRDELAQAGIVVEDTAHGPRWSLRGAERTGPSERTGSSRGGNS